LTAKFTLSFLTKFLVMPRSLKGFLIGLCLISSPLFAQNYFREVILKTDTLSFSLSKDVIVVQGERQLAFQYFREDEVCEVRLYPHSFENLGKPSLMPSGDYDIIDSIANINQEYFRFKVRFNGLTKTQFLNFNFSFEQGTVPGDVVYQLKLFPYTYTYAKFYPESEELYIGEEKTFELITNRQHNIQVNNAWTNGQGIDYRLSEEDGKVRLHLLPGKLGVQLLNLEIQTIKPFVDEKKIIRYKLPVITKEFTVKASRLAFLNVDLKEVTLDEESQRKGIEVQLDNSRLLSLQKTYRIEAQEEPGGALIAEIFTRSYLSNGRILCWLRLFNYHRKSDGYLYLKDGDAARCITNFSITPKTTITSVSILREGADWTTNLSIRPGETIGVKIEGQGLNKANYTFEDLINLGGDSLIRNENLAVYKLRVPLNITRRKVDLYNNSVRAGLSLSVREYESPRPLDFVLVNVGDGDRSVATLTRPVLYGQTIKDLVISFDRDRIDSDKKLYGKQYISVDIRITGNRGELVELKTIENLVICPGDYSPRFVYYNDPLCKKGSILLNDYISRKTYDLDDWSTIELTFKHDKSKYGGDGFSQKVTIVLKKSYRFDIDVSFPAGLLVKESGKREFNNLYGVSLAVIAQFSFYDPEKIARYRPYKIGAGFLAFNAFNLSSAPGIDRDVGVVLLGSLYPTRRDVKLTFPLYLGGGYYLSKNKWFVMIGPGIQLRL
jgi:hypothetical protein